MKPIETILTAVKCGALLDERIFQNSDIESILIQRDGDESFEGEWIRLHNLLSKVNLPSSDEDNLLLKLREIAYKKTYDLTESLDMCAVVSDDFDLIGRGVELLPMDPFVASLLHWYLLHQIPSSQPSEAPDLPSLLRIVRSEIEKRTTNEA